MWFSVVAAGRRARDATSHQSGDAPFPLVDLVRPRPVRNGEEAVRRYVDHRRTIGSSTMDYWYVVDQVATRDLLPPRGEEIPGLEYHTGLLRAAAMTCRTEMDEAIAERLRIRPLIELAFGPLGAYYVDLLNLDNEITADSIAELSQDVVRDERLQRATSLIGQIEAQVEDLVSTELLDPGGTDALVLAADALLVGASVLTDLHAKDEALGAIQVVARAAEAVPEDRHAERMDDILDMARAEVLAECGDVYNGCLLAEEVMRRHEKVSPVLAARGRRLLGISSMEVGQFDEAIAQFREQANIMLAAGITLYAVASLLSLGSALEASERYLESAEVLESALSLAQRSGAKSIALYLHRLLAQTGMAMGEEESVAEHSLAAARILQEQGRRALAGDATSLGRCWTAATIGNAEADGEAGSTRRSVVRLCWPLPMASGLCFRPSVRPLSSVGQSCGLLIRRSWVRAPQGVPTKSRHTAEYRRFPQLTRDAHVGYFRYPLATRWATW